MAKKESKNVSLVILRRDLRCEDNTALLEACKNSEYVLPCFIFDPRQVSDNNAYKSTNCIEFMIESLQDLAASLKKRGGKLFVFYGPAHEIVEHLLSQLSINTVYCNKDYTPFSVMRDAQIQNVCEQRGCTFTAYHDALLINPETLLNKQQRPYTIFTPFFKVAHNVVVDHPQAFHYKNFYTGFVAVPSIDLKQELTKKGVICTTRNVHRAVKGGRSKSALLLQQIKKFKTYEKTHDMPALATTHLSAYLKFGTHSVREVWHAIFDALDKDHPLLRQLYWRDFFTYIAWHAPHVVGHAFRKQYDNLAWKNSESDFKKWCQGHTGFPIVDAGMRELNATGFMHNRVRMIVASFLVKDLHIDWRWGERYFAQKLVDYDLAVNNGNWQWCASTGCDAQPYFRIFNPWLQQKKFDPECNYIKTWVPELREYEAQAIHRHATKHLEGYEVPMVNHTKERLKTMALFKKITHQ